MILTNVRKVLRFDFLMLLPILDLAFYIAFIPHQSYLYPLHVDDWVHIAHSNAILQSGSTTYVEPFSVKE